LLIIVIFYDLAKLLLFLSLEHLDLLVLLLDAQDVPLLLGHDLLPLVLLLLLILFLGLLSPLILSLLEPKQVFPIEPTLDESRHVTS
jgi:hypothetical protein